jgi:hypothetical protein
MYVSGVQCMKELANTMRQQSIIDSEQMRQNISTNANAIGNVRNNRNLYDYNPMQKKQSVEMHPNYSLYMNTTVSRGDVFRS